MHLHITGFTQHLQGMHPPSAGIPTHATHRGECAEHAFTMGNLIIVIQHHVCGAVRHQEHCNTMQHALTELCNLWGGVVYS